MTLYWLWISVSFCFALSGYVYNRIGEARDRIRSPPIGEMIDIGACRLHLIRKGAGGPTVVIETGSGGSSFTWWAHQDKLADLTTVCTYDRAGLGWSDSTALQRTLAERAEDLHALLVRAQLPQPYVLVGFSLGGLLIRLFARDHPAEVAGMVFVDAGHEAEYTRSRLHANRMSTLFRIWGCLSTIGVLRLLRYRPMVPPASMLTVAQLNALKNRLPTAHAYFVGAEDQLSVKGCDTAMMGTNTPGLLGDIPIAVITHGIPFPGFIGVSEKNWYAAQEQLAALSTNSTLTVASKSGHMIPLDEPELVLDAIRSVVSAARENKKLATIG